jgi:hypothetical protein
MERTVTVPSREDLELDGGYVLARPSERMLHLKAPTGAVCLTIRLDPGGPSVELRGAALRLATDGDLDVECDRFRVRARSEVAISSGGPVTTAAGGDIITEGDALQQRARLGGIELTANDDVALSGERIRLNCPEVVGAPRPVAELQPGTHGRKAFQR